MTSVRILPGLCLTLVIAATVGCGAADAPQILADGLTIRNPYDGLWQDREEVPIRFELEQTFGAEEDPVEAALSYVTEIATDEAGNIYVLDGVGPVRLISFSSDGSFRWALEENGQAPGELNEPSGMQWAPGFGLMLSNQHGTRLERFGADGEHLEERALTSLGFQRAQLAGYLAPDRLLFARSAGWMRAEAKIVRMDSMLTVLASVEASENKGEEPVGQWFMLPTFSFRDGISVAGAGEYVFTLYDGFGEARRLVRRENTEILPPACAETAERSGCINYGGIRRPLAIEDDRWLTQVTWPTNVDDPDEFLRQLFQGSSMRPEWANSIDVYDDRDRLLYVLRGEGSDPEIGKLLHTDHVGRLYTSVRQPYPHIRRYRVIIDQ